MIRGTDIRGAPPVGGEEVAGDDLRQFANLENAVGGAIIGHGVSQTPKGGGFGPLRNVPSLEACPELDPLAGGRHSVIARHGITADFEFLEWVVPGYGN